MIDASIDGVWYSASSAGQGMTLRFDPVSGQLLMPWFTFSREVGNRPESLRWFLGNGVVASGATNVRIPLFETTSGSFDVASEATSRLVGEAVLRYAACDRVELTWSLDRSFAIDEDGIVGGDGTMTLQRLLPAGIPCVGAGTNPPHQGYDPSLSGVWHSPSVQGQGFDLFRSAPTGSSDGILAGAWFTHDPAGTSQEPARSQHWFALAGSGLSENGVVYAEIIQSLGGHLGGTPTRNGQVVGEIVFRSESCARLRAGYRFDDSEIAGEFRGLAGDVLLQRVAGSCMSAER